MRTEALIICAVLAFAGTSHAEKSGDIPLWGRFEAAFTSAKAYDNPLYDVRRFEAVFTSPSGRSAKRAGFWDGGVSWKVRFMPDEIGTWKYTTSCSDDDNSGLHDVSGSFECVPNTSSHDIFSRGRIERPKGEFHLVHADGTPFFWFADTAWNGPLRSTDDEWALYLDNRADKGFNVIQFVTTQWRGGDRDENGRDAFEGSGYITVDTEYFRRLDNKIDVINDRGLVAAPVLLWALQRGAGRHLSPGYHLPHEEAILLAKYMVARYGGHHVVWLLGGDGDFLGEYEQRWKTIGRGVFGSGDHPGLVTLHPCGRSWYGDAYRDEDWLDIIGYQSSHSTSQGTVEFITKGPATNDWANIPPRPLINLEPLYENIRDEATVRDVRNACWWSILATPVAGITYGANGVWSWLREGETILNHRHNPQTKIWRASLDFPGVRETAFLASFMRSFPWWNLMPAPDLLADQPGDKDYRRFVSVAATFDKSLVIAYIPDETTVTLYNTRGMNYRARWFDPAANSWSSADITTAGNRMVAESPAGKDIVLVLEESANP